MVSDHWGFLFPDEQAPAMFKFRIELEQEEAASLATLAEAERRDVRQQAEILIVSELKRRGLLESRESKDAQAASDRGAQL